MSLPIPGELTQRQHPAHLGVTKRHRNDKLTRQCLRPGHFILAGAAECRLSTSRCPSLVRDSSAHEFIHRLLHPNLHVAEVTRASCCCTGRDGWLEEGGGGEAFPASWLDSTRWRVLGAGLDGRSARGDGRAKRAGGHTHIRTSTRGQLSPPSSFKLKDSQLGRQ